MTFSRRSTEYVFGIILKVSVFSIVAHLLNLAIHLKQQRKILTGEEKVHVQQLLQQQRDIHTQIKAAIETYKADSEVSYKNYEL